jgi:hypothetical protein
MLPALFGLCDAAGGTRNENPNHMAGTIHWLPTQNQQEARWPGSHHDVPAGTEDRHPARTEARRANVDSPFDHIRGAFHVFS